MEGPEPQPLGAQAEDALGASPSRASQPGSQTGPWQMGVDPRPAGPDKWPQPDGWLDPAAGDGGRVSCMPLRKRIAAREILAKRITA